MTQEIKCVLNILLNSVFQVYVASGRQRRGCCEKKPEAAPCGTQPDPTHVLQRTAESLSQAGDTSGKTCSRKGTPKSEESGGGTSPWNSRYPLQAMENARVEHKDIPEGTEARGESTSEQRKDVMRKKAERHHYVLAATPLPFSM